MTILTDFYNGLSTDDKGRTIHDMHKFSFDELEYVHDYIQWMFPLKEFSFYNPTAPLVCDQDIVEFCANRSLYENLLKSFYIMLKFYGLTIDDNKFSIIKDSTFPERSAVWLSKHNHNFLRISRIIRSLKLFRANDYADEFFKCLEEIYKENKELISVSYVFWKDALVS